MAKAVNMYPWIRVTIRAIHQYCVVCGLTGTGSLMFLPSLNISNNPDIPLLLYTTSRQSVVR